MVHHSRLKEVPIGIFSKNRAEWSIVAHACDAYSLQIVPLYETLGQESIKYIIELVGLEIVCVDSLKSLENLYKSLKELKEEGKNHVRHLVYFNEDAKQRAEQIKEELQLESVIFWENLRRKGQEKKVKHNPPQPESISTICFTSGTTGLPKFENQFFHHFFYILKY